MTEWSGAHEAGDCLPNCPHLDHAYDDDFGDLDLEYLFELRQNARRSPWPPDDYDWGEE